MSKQIALCADQGGEDTATTLASDTDSTPTSGITVYDPTLSVATGTVYFRQSERTSTMSTIETIQRVSVRGGPSTTIVTAPQNNGDEGVALGSPQVSPDGRYLAYVITVGQLVGVPSSAIPTPTGTLAPLGTHVLILDVGADATAPISVASTLTGPELSGASTGYQLIGWSPDDRALYYFAGASPDLRVLTFDATGRPTGSSSVYKQGPVQGGCPDNLEASAISPDGDVYVAADCQQGPVSIERLHNGHVSTFASVPELTGGWMMQDLTLDTAGRFLQLDAEPFGHCLAGQAHIALLDGVVIAKQIQTDPYGCPPGTPASPTQ